MSYMTDDVLYFNYDELELYILYIHVYIPFKVEIRYVLP